MNVNSFLLERVLRQLKLSDDSLRQFRFVSASGNVSEGGFPKELFELSAPVVIRGLLNFSVLQMNKNWIYPFWVHQQLDPRTSAFVARSQNPLLINVTHRNWTALGSPTGFHEAIVDPRGLVTPLPREWSVDTYIVEKGEAFFPSLSSSVEQHFETDAPCVTTSFQWRGLKLQSEAFTATVRGTKDVVFCRTTILNQSLQSRSVQLCVGLRPFGVEGVAPITSIEFRSRRVAFIDGVVGVVFARDPDVVVFGSAILGDAAHRMIRRLSRGHESRVSCAKGLANASAVFDVTVAPGGEQSICYSVALGTNSELKPATVKRTWRVSFAKRKESHTTVWRKELEGSLKLEFGDESLERLFNASRTALLQLQDGDFISPGPYLYHHFWIRDAAPMLKALDVLGFPRRVRQVIDGFPNYLKPDGFYRAPGGEWDSNGEVLWVVYEHYRFTRSLLWLKQLYPSLATAGRWIIRMRRRTKETQATHKGLMPPSLSAEHLGTVDQYYWDSFWSLAGLRALSMIAHEVQRAEDAIAFEKEAVGFEHDILESFKSATERLGAPLIPATPFRSFDESSIGSVSSVYPLNLFDASVENPSATLKTIVERFIDDRGFYHPIIHSGYNAYLTLHVAHALLEKGEFDEAWRIAASVFRQATACFAFPEAIHPKTGGGAMGDGHHGWAAAEVVLFLRDCLVRERGNVIELFAGASTHLLKAGRNLKITDARTAFGQLDVSLEFVSDSTFNISFASEFFPKTSLKTIDVFIPWNPRKISPSSPQHFIGIEELSRGVKLRFAPDVTSVLVHLEG